MKKIIQRTLSVLCICSVTIILLMGVSNVVERKDSVIKNADFFDHPEPTDVMFFGSSHMLNAVFPVELWEDYGISSYSFAGHGSRVPTNYWIMRNAFDYATPKAVVVDCYFLAKDEMKDSREEFLHISFDAFPLTKTKIEAINEVIGSDGDRMAYLFPFSTYHSRWKELGKTDFCWDASPEAGGSIRNSFTSLARYEKAEFGDVTPDNSLGVVYLRKLIEYCQERNIEVVLTYVPFVAAAWAQKEDCVAEQIAQEYGIAYVGLEELSNQINFATDLADTGHLNYSGGSKITKYLGQKLRTEFNIPDRSDDPSCSFWTERLHRYTKLKIEMANAETSATRFLTLMADEALSNIVLYNGQWDNDGVEAILMDWGVPQDLLDKNNTFAAVIDNTNRSCEIVTEGQKLQTVFGEIELECQDSMYKVIVEGETYGTIDLQDDVALWIYTLDASTWEYVSESCFNTKGYRSSLE